MRRLVQVLMLAGLTFAPAVARAQSPPATQVIVDVFAGANPATVAANYGIVTEQVFTEVANAFTANVTARQITLLEADVDVQQVTADGVAGRIPRPRILLTRPEGGAPPPIPGQPPQFITAAMRRVKAPLSVTASINGIDDRRVDADIAILDGGVHLYRPTSTSSAASIASAARRRIADTTTVRPRHNGGRICGRHRQRDRHCRRGARGTHLGSPRSRPKRLCHGLSAAVRP